MTNFVWALAASAVVSLVSFVGALGLLLKKNNMSGILIVLVGFAAGSLIGCAFMHLLPEALMGCSDPVGLFLYVLLGFVLFFVLEKYLYWRHCHKERCEVHTFATMNLVGDGLHNIMDGMIMGAMFAADLRMGFVATAAILMHEIPQELGDFGVLLYAGLKRGRALLLNFLSALGAILGTVAGFYFAESCRGFSAFLVPVAAGGFIYIGACDLIPELHRQPDKKMSVMSMLSFFCGLAFMLLLKAVH